MRRLTLFRDSLKFKFSEGAEMHVSYQIHRHMRFGAVGSDVGRINEVTLRRARLVLGWVTVSGFNSRCGKFISV